MKSHRISSLYLLHVYKITSEGFLSSEGPMMTWPVFMGLYGWLAVLVLSALYLRCNLCFKGRTSDWIF